MIGVGLGCFAELRHLHVVSTVSLIASVGAAALTFVGTGLEHVKRALEVEKLLRERKQAKDENREKTRLIQPASPGDVARTIDEMKEFGSYRERQILYRAVEEKSELRSNRFLAANSSEEPRHGTLDESSED